MKIDPGEVRREAESDAQASDFEEEEKKTREMVKEDKGRKVQMIGHKDLEIWLHKMQEKKCGKWSERYVWAKEEAGTTVALKNDSISHLSQFLFAHSSTWFDNLVRFALFLPTDD